MSNPITIEGVRFSYCSLFQPTAPHNNPNGDLKYRTTILLPKDNARAKALIDQAIAQATEEGVNKKWGGVKPPMVPNPVYDGDGTRPSDGAAYGPECKGCWVFTASSSNAPFVVDAQVQPIINPVEVYSGMYGNVNVTFYPYFGGGRKGVGCGLNGVQKVNDGEPLSGSRVTAESAFSAVQSQAAPAYGSPALSAPSGGYPAPGGYTPAPGQNSPQTAPAAPQQGYPASGYGAAPAAPATPGYGTAPAAPGQQYIDTGSGEVLNYYPQNGIGPSGYPVQPYQG